MKRSSVIITTVESKLQIAETELYSMINKQNKSFRLWKRKTKNKRPVIVEDYGSISCISLDIPLRGQIEICFANEEERHFILKMPAKTSFLVTPVKGRDGRYRAEISTSLS